MVRRRSVSRSPARVKSPAKSPSRGKSPARGRSPARVKSPVVRSRSRSRSASPAPVKAVRKVGRPKSPKKSPSRPKSPGRPKSRARSKSPGKPKSPGRPKSPARPRKKFIKEIEIDVVDRPVSTESSTEPELVKPESSGLRRSSRVASYIGDAPKEVKALNNGRQGRKHQFDIWGSLGSLVVVFLVPGIFLLFNLACTKAHCVLKPFAISTSWRTYFDRDAGLLYAGYILLQFILALLPIGQQIDVPFTKGGRHKVRCNGFFAAIVSLAILFGLYHQRYPVDIVYDKFIPFLVSGIVFGTILSLILYIRGGRAPVSTLNPAGTSGNFIKDFVAGRQICPLFGHHIDVKFILHRASLIGILIVNNVLLLKGLDSFHSDYPPALMIATGLQIWYAFDYVWFEESWLHSYEYQQEGAGFVSLVGYSIWPFVPTVVSKFVVDNRVDLPWYALALIVIAHNFGYVIYRASTGQKTEFRKNPLKPSLAHLDTIPTSLGKKLLASGWWGWVRHPNYLGVLLMHLCWAACCGVTHALPYFYPLLTLTIIILHTLKVEERCRQRYSAAWDRYCDRVKYRILPRVF